MHKAKMSISRLGASCGPNTRFSFREANPHWEEGNDVVDDADGDRPVQCPFDSNHIVKTCRFAYHIQKCEKNNPEMAAQMMTCPYNAQHRMLKYEMEHHVKKCVDRKTSPQAAREILPKFQVDVNSFKMPKSNEDWECETDDFAETFVWSVAPQKPEIRREQATRISADAPRLPRQPNPWKR